MSAARLVSAALAFTACAVFGAVRRARIRRERETAAMLTADVAEFERLLRLERRPLSEIAGWLARNGGCKALWRGVEEGMEQGETFRNAYAAAEKPEAGKAAAAVLDALAGSIGSGDAEGESDRLKKAGDELAEISALMQKSCAEKEKLIGTLSLLAGAAAALLMI